MTGFEAEIARIIQLAVAPVFLIMGIGGILSVLLGRLKLIYRRYRRVVASEESREVYGFSDDERAELKWLDRRLQLMHRSIILSTLSILLVCLVVITLFIEEFIRVDLSSLVAGLFVAAMSTLVAALIFFLIEIRIAMRMLRVRKEFLDAK